MKLEDFNLAELDRKTLEFHSPTTRDYDTVTLDCLHEPTGLKFKKDIIVYRPFTEEIYNNLLKSLVIQLKSVVDFIQSQG